MSSFLSRSLLGAFILTAPWLHAQDATWTGTSSSAWNVAGNWTPGIPTGEALFTLAGSHTINVDAATTTGNIRFGNGTQWTFSGSRLTLSNPGTSSGSRPLGVYNANTSVTFNNEVRFLGTAASGDSQLGLNNTNGTLDLAGGVRGNSAISGFALRTASSGSVKETIIRGSISEIALLNWNIKNTTLDLQASSSVSLETIIQGDNTLLKLGHDQALGTGTLTLNHSSASNAPITLEATGAARSYANAITFNGGYSNPESGTGTGMVIVSGAYDLAFSGAVTFSRNTNLSVDSGRRFTLSGNIGSGKNLTKSGAGTLVLSGASIAHGQTLVSAGTLLLNGTLNSSGSNAVTVDGSGVLGGTGTILRQVTFTSSGGIGGGLNPGDDAVGDGIGTLTLGGIGNARPLALLDDTRLTFDLRSPLEHDQIHLFGDLTLDGVLTLKDRGVSESGDFLLFTYTGAFQNHGVSFGMLPAHWRATLDTGTNGEVWLQLQVVPEPSSMVLLLVSAGALLLWRKKAALRPAC